MYVITAENLTRTYRTSDIEAQAERATFSAEPGSFISFVGPSGQRQEYAA